MFRTSLLLAAVLFGFSLSSPTYAAANTGIGGSPIDDCRLDGGTIIPQPAGSTITACCYDDDLKGCWICDEAGNDCVFDTLNVQTHLGRAWPGQLVDDGSMPDWNAAPANTPTIGHGFPVLMAR